MNKERALFYLRRYRNDLETKAMFDHELAAKQGMPYNERLNKLEEADKFKHEYETLCWIYDQIASMDDKPTITL